MTSPLSVISAGSFFTGLMREYSSLGWPGTTVVGTNSILSIRPSSIAAMRTLRANGEVGENVSFIGYSFKERKASNFRLGRACPGHPRLSCCDVVKTWMPGTSPGMTSFCKCSRANSRRDNFLPLFAEPLDAERDHVADIEEFRRLHAGADTGRRARGDDVAGQQGEERGDVGDAFRHREDHGRGRSGLAALAVDIEPHRQFLHVR